MNRVPFFTRGFFALLVPLGAVLLLALARAAECLPEIPASLPPPVPRPIPATAPTPELFRISENVVLLAPPAPGPKEAAASARKGLARTSAAPPTPTDTSAPEDRSGQDIGFVRSIAEEAPDQAEFARPRRGQLPDGRTVWTLAVQSPGAQFLRLHLTHVSLGSGELIVYGRSGDAVVAHGPYRDRGPRGRGEFWTPSLPGAMAFVEYIGDDVPQFEVSEVGHIDALSLDVAPGEPGRGCHINANCQDDLPVLARNATGLMCYIVGGKTKLCSGTLLADEDPSTVVPYFISAYHCISSQAVAETLEVVWLWQTPCGGTPPDFSQLPRSNGATLLETSPTNGGNDMAFLRLDGTVPSGVSMAGWSTAEPPKSDDAPRFASHHPSGAWLRGGRFHRIAPFIVCKDLIEYYAFRCDTGLIENGSSGSGIFNGAGQLQGHLFGRCCPAWLNGDENCEDAGCDNRGSWTALYGRFDRSWGKVGKWLAGIGGTIHVDAAAAPGGNGSISDPFKRLSDAHALSWPGSRILMKAGSYPEALVLSKPTPILAEGASAVVGK